MRLLGYDEDGELTITSFNDNELPPYAILSHTWGADNEEVTFADLMKGDGKAKPGYEKIRFCGEQARHDGLQYFWIDTCCINKENYAELSLAINSMFRWYRNSTRCYVYLSDVSSPPLDSNAICRPQELELQRTGWCTWVWVSLVIDPLFRWYYGMIRRFVLLSNIPCPQSCRSKLQKSRWFSRGWTLQELLAPSCVEFFSRERHRLGDITSLTQQIHEITGIPKTALEGAPLSQFSDKDRFSWIQCRQTKIEEDKAYSLLGIFGVEMPLRYGEGASNAFKRLEDEINKLNNFLRHFCLSDPHEDKKRIEETKGGLLPDLYRWVLDNPTFQQWQHHSHSRLLWVKGDPGKGKTMLLCGIIDELHNSMPKFALLSYFFCQATDSRINNATAVLRGLLYMLMKQQPSLVSNVRKKHNDAGRTVFEDANAWVALTEIFVDVLQDPCLHMTYLVIDAVDECLTDRPKLLAFIAKQLSISDRVKWVVSSRNWSGIQSQLEQSEHKVTLSLELNAKSVAAAVDMFVHLKVDQLSQEKQYKAEIQHAVLQHLMFNANDSFLWVALVCQSLQSIANRHVLEKLALFPPGLDDLYKQMMRQVGKSDDARICCRILASVAVLHRPVTVSELVALVEQLENFGDDVRELIGLCESFITLREDTIYFVHQSAKEFLFAKASGKVFPDGAEDIHRAIFLKSMEILSRTLHRDMYRLEAPGFSIDNIEAPDEDLLAVSRYPCIYWVDHLYDSRPKFSTNSGCDIQVRGAIDTFLKNKYLYWLEAISLCKSIEKGIVSMTKLWLLIQEMKDQDQLTQLVQDARRFITYHKVAIMSYPLQTYASALLFSPTNSLITRLFQHEAPRGISINPAMSDSWSVCLQTFEGHIDYVGSVAFSHDSAKLASASDDKTVKIWDTSSGACFQTLEGHINAVSSVVFSHNSAKLASASWDKTVKIWDASSGACLHTLEGHIDYVVSVAFSHNSTKLASASDDKTVKIWDTSSGVCLHTLQSHSRAVSSVAFSHDSAKLASASWDKTVKIWDANSGSCLQTLEGHNNTVNSVAFSHDSARLASASGDNTVKIWDASNGACLQTLKGHIDYVSSVAFFHDSSNLASASDDKTVKIWDASSGACLQTLDGHSSVVSSVAFSHDSTKLASASWDRTIKIWDESSCACLQTLESHIDYVSSVVLSPDSAKLASASDDKTVKIWDASSCSCLQTLKGHIEYVSSVAFSHDSTQLASSSYDKTVKIWDVSSGECLQTLEGHSSAVSSVAFSHDSARLASASDDNTIKIWDMSRSACLQTLYGHIDYVGSVAFSHDSVKLASASYDNTIKIWDASSGTCLQTLNGHSSTVSSVAFSHDSTKLASASWDRTVKIWDTSNSACLQTLYFDKILFTLSFNCNSSILFTDIGTIVIQDSEVLSMNDTKKHERPLYQSTSLSTDNTWIRYDESNMLWFPSEYRPSCSCVGGSTVYMGVRSGRVWSCRIDL